MQMEKNEEEGGAHKAEQEAFGLFNKGEGAARRSDAQRRLVVCSPSANILSLMYKKSSEGTATYF